MAQCDFSWLPFGAGGIPANENSGTSVVSPRWYLATAAPSGAGNQGDIAYNATPSTSSIVPLYWVCTTSATGSPASGAVWTAVYSVQTNIATTTTIVTGTLAIGTRFFALNGATGPNLSLPEASSFSAGTVLTIENIAANTATLTPLGTDAIIGFPSAAITLSQNQSVNLISAGSTNWYSVTTPQLSSLTTTATSGTLSVGYRLILLNPASTGTYSLPEASTFPVGSSLSIKNLASGSTTLTPLGTDQYDGGVAAITLAQNAVVQLSANGTTNWYKSA